MSLHEDTFVKLTPDGDVELQAAWWDRDGLDSAQKMIISADGFRGMMHQFESLMQEELREMKEEI